MGYRILIVLILCLSVILSCSKEPSKTEITITNAIRIATNFADKKKFNTQNADVEIVKVKKGLERGSITLTWLVTQFPRATALQVINNEFWVVYFYPKGQLESANTLGGDFCVLVDLYSGDVIESLVGL